MLSTDIPSVMGDLGQEKPQLGKRASGSRRCVQQRGRTVLCPIVSRMCTWGTSGTSLCRMRLTKSPRAWWVLGESGCKNRNSFGLQFFLLAVECSDLSLMREKKPEREGGGGRRCFGGNVNQQRWCLSCCTVRLSTSVGCWQPQSHPAWDGDSSHSFVPGSPPLSGLGACWGCSKPTSSSNNT